MSADRFFDGFALAALACLALLGIGRGVMLAARGILVVPIDRERTVVQSLADLAFLLGFLIWIYETLAFAFPLGFHILPDATRAGLDASALRAFGALLAVAGVLVYALALRDLGTSWRLSIDRDHAGDLVTSGVFARTRNPIYMGIALLTLGTSLALGRLALFGLVCVFPVYFRYLIGREERFLAQHYGAAYRDYAARTGRWWTWRRG